MDDLIVFLNARYDEAAAPRAVPDWHEDWCINAAVEDGVCIYCGAEEDPARVEYVPQSAFRLADIAAKRQIITMEPPEQFDDPHWVGFTQAHEETLRLLALPFALHPEFREEWRP